MDRLNSCSVSPPVASGRGFFARLQDKTRAALELHSPTTAIAAYNLDGAEWDPHSKCPDGVLIIESGDNHPALVCFVELKGKVRDPARPYLQLDAGVLHFASALSPHGSQHHDHWRQDEDLPLAPQGRQMVEIRLPADHLLFGVILVSRGGTRLPVERRTHGSKSLALIPLQLHGSNNQVSMPLADFLAHLGFPP